MVWSVSNFNWVWSTVAAEVVDIQIVFLEVVELSENPGVVHYQG